MVFFTCLNCNESLQKPKVAKHYTGRCYGPINVTCVDCLKDFRGNEYEAHVKCLTEEERYSAKGFVAKPSSCKGEKKQQSWFEAVQNILNTDDSLKHDERELLEVLSSQENLPRKKGKFLNFIANAHRGYARRQELIERVWNIIEKAGKAAIETPKAPEEATSKEDAAETNGTHDNNTKEESKEKQKTKKEQKVNGVEKSEETKTVKKRKNKSEDEIECKKQKLEEDSSRNIVFKVLGEEGPTTLYKLCQSIEKYCADEAGVEKGPKKYKKLLKKVTVEFKDGVVVLNCDKLDN